MAPHPPLLIPSESFSPPKLTIPPHQRIHAELVYDEYHHIVADLTTYFIDYVVWEFPLCKMAAICQIVQKT